VSSSSTFYFSQAAVFTAACAEIDAEAASQLCTYLPIALLLLLLLLVLLQMLHTAKQDERVRGVMAVLGGRENFGGMAQLQELRNALLDFRVSILSWGPSDGIGRRSPAGIAQQLQDKAQPYF
jgi:hypothetical protein